MSNQPIDRLSVNRTAPCRVAFDEIHGESWTISRDKAKQVNPKDIWNCSFADFAEIFAKKGAIVSRNTSSKLDKSYLLDLDILVIAHPVDSSVIRSVEGSPVFTQSEIDSVQKWVEDGGALLIIYEHSTEQWKSNINDLSSRFGVKFNDDCIIDPIYNDSSSQTSPKLFVRETPNRITEKIEYIVYYAGCSLSVDNTAVSFLHSNPTSFPPNAPVIAGTDFGRGRVLCIGDGDLFDPIRIKQHQHVKLTENIYNWLSEPRAQIDVKAEISLSSKKDITGYFTFENKSHIDFELICDFSFEGSLSKFYTTEAIFLLSRESHNLSFDLTNFNIPENRKITASLRVKNDLSYKNNFQFIRFGWKRFQAAGRMEERLYIDEAELFSERIFTEKIALMARCPLNASTCVLTDDIKSAFRPSKIFLNIPYSPEYKEFEDVLIDECVAAGLLPIIARNSSLSGMLLCNVCEQIQTCAFGIAEITQENANIFYELGLLHALGKKCAVLRHDDSITEPSDIKGMLYIDYSNSSDLRSGFRDWLRRHHN